MSRRGRHGTARVAILAALLAASPLAAQPAPAPVAEQTPVVAIVGGTVHTMGDAGTLEGATVVLRDGRVAAVGTGVEPPQGATVVDARGKVVTPGLFDSFTQIGLVEINAVGASDDAETDLDRVTAAFRVADALNPASTLVAVARVEGLTRALVVPGADGALIAGQAAVVQLGAGLDDGPAGMVVRAPVAMYAVLGEEGAEMAGGSRAAALLVLREALQDARDYAANRAAFERGERRPYALSRLDLEALAPVVAGELPLLVAADRASDLLAAVRFAEEEGLRLVLAGAAEGWMVADALAAAGVPVLLQPLANLPASFESLGATLANAARLHAAGVPVALMSGDSHNARNLRQDAGNAVAWGLPWDAALAAMTTVPARIWGLEGRYGRLEPGYEADVVVWDGDPLELTTYPERVFIRGEEMPRDSRQTRLRDRYLDLPEEGELPPAYRHGVPEDEVP